MDTGPPCLSKEPEETKELKLEYKTLLSATALDDYPTHINAPVSKTQIPFLESYFTNKSAPDCGNPSPADLACTKPWSMQSCQQKEGSNHFTLAYTAV